MMHRCSSSHQGNMMGQCTCGLFHSQSNSFTMLFSMPNHNHHHHNKSFDETDMYPFASSSSSVDCTLSLGTPSTRLSEDVVVDDKRIRHERRPSSCMSNFCWDILQPNNNKNTPYSSSQSHKTTSRATNSTSNNNSSSNNDSLLARRCANCDTTSTPLWRNGPRGPKSLCNACGIRFKKEERRANANSNNNSASASSSSSGTMDHHYANYQNSSWVQTQKMPCFSTANEFRFIEDSDRDSDSTIPFLSWRLNVTDRPSLVHDFTR